MSANNSPPTEKREVMSRTRDQTESPSRGSNIPLIELPCTFDAKGEMLVESLSDKCRSCGWDGTPRDIFVPESQAMNRKYKVKVTRHELQEEGTRCLCCKIRLLFLEEITRYEGASSEASDLLLIETLYNGRVSYGVVFLGHSRSDCLFYDIFIPIESSLPDIDGTFTLSRRRTAYDASLEDSMDHSIKWAQQPISDCLRLHRQCAIQIDSPIIPTRLLDVDPDGKGMGTNVQLQDFSSATPGTSIEYAALSYCWGSYKPECMTTRETLARNLCRIPSGLLPQTFYDAVKVTRGLGLKYLWIDSVCIIQGDENDWRREAGRMFDVYRGSKITLAAVSGKDSRAGLRTTTIKQQTHMLAKLNLGQFTYPLYFRNHHYLWYPETGFSLHLRNPNVPLLTRAWIYQERMLSPRILFFTESEVIFQCTCEVKCECGSATDGWKNRIIDYCDKLRFFLATRPNADDQSLNDKETVTEELFKIQETWRTLVVCDYSILALTNPRDKLAALGAIAEQFQRVRPGARYLAGLWSDSLLDDMLWLSYGSTPPYQSRSQDREEPDRPFNLPTWSWASMGGGVHYGREFDQRRYCVEVVEATCIYANDNSFGVLENSTLILRGILLSCVIHRNGQLIEPSSLGEDAWECLSTDAMWDSRYPQEQEVYLLHVRDCGHKGFSTYACGLILNLEDCNANPRIFSRLGYFSDNSLANGEEFYPLDRALKERGTLEEIEIR
ncbi:heterokaryon incompatibility protein-domain-containing protein [Phyllosticta capitalensis]|uniref:heterokaryon incompatibility protein-domain-containing protein n=1 Tax=Phyllosticta capitalensis TaxID=121624 RepID=UPI00312E8274